MRRCWAWSWTIGVVLAACIHPHPNPNPTPTPTPTPTPGPSGRPSAPVFTNLLLRAVEGRLQVGGLPFRLVGAIPCWPPCDDPGCLKVDGKVVAYDWPLVSTQWMDVTRAKGVNAFHIRPGPVRAADQCCGLQGLGGPYQETPPQLLRRLNPKTARATPAWNQKFFDRIYELHYHAGANGQIIENDVFDGWVGKMSQRGDMALPWPAVDVANLTAVPLNTSLATWVDKYVFETCLFGDAYYQISNESPGMVGWSPEWERAMYARIRQAEQQPGCDGKVIHAIASNSRDYDGPYELFEQHNEGVVSPIAGRPVLENEWNPHATPASFDAMCKAALAQGTGCWYWRSDGSDADQDASLNSILQPVDAGCSEPKPDRNRLAFGLNCDANNNCDSTPLNEGDLAFCQAIGMGEYNGQPRATCPVRPECAFDSPPSAICHQRLACEQFDIGSASPVFTSDGSWRYVDDGHFRVKVDGGTYLQACNVEGTRCSRVALR